MKKIIICLLSLYGIISYATSDVKIAYLADHNTMPTILAVAELWRSGQPEHIQELLHGEKVVLMVKELEKHIQKDTLPLCKIAFHNHQLVGMIRILHHWTNDTHKSPVIAAHPEWMGWICGLIIKKEYQDESLKNALLIDAENEIRRFGYKEAYYPATEEEITWCITNGYTFLTKATYRDYPVLIFKKTL